MEAKFTTAQRQRLTRARTLLLLDHPFFGNLATRLANVPDPTGKVNTCTTNGLDIKWNPAHLDKLSERELMGTIAKAVLHCAHGHPWRRGNRDKGAWQTACNLVTNGILQDANIPLPQGAVYPQAGQEGKAAESLYMAPTPSDEDGYGDGDSAAQAGDGGAAGTGGAPGNQNAPAGPDGGQDGQGNPTPDPTGCGTVSDAPPTPEEGGGNELTQEWRVAVGQAAEAAKACGSMPGNLIQIVKDLVDPSVPWENALAEFVTRTARNDYNWRRPNTRHLASGFILPSLISDELPPVVVVVDTSGSTAHARAQFASEVSAVLGAFDTTVHVVYCDTRVAGEEVYTRADMPLELKNYGGGGTKFGPPFRWVEEKQLQPSCLIYLTDMQGSCDAPEPEYPVLWVSTEKGTPPFGEFILMC